MRQSGGDVGNAHRIPEKMAEVGNTHEGPGEEKLGTLGEVGTAEVRVQETTGGTCMGNNGTHPEREGGGGGLSDSSRWRGRFVQQW